MMVDSNFVLFIKVILFFDCFYFFRSICEYQLIDKKNKEEVKK